MAKWEGEARVFGAKDAVPTSLELFSISWEEIVKNALYTPKLSKCVYKRTKKAKWEWAFHFQKPLP